MKPISLQLNGFRSYPNTVTIDFTGKTLTAVLGDTGAGKSSLLDAITFALFRSSSWDGRDLRQLIADGVTAMSVSFTFLAEGHRWRVDRTMHATNPNGGRHHLTNLDTGEEVDGAGAVDDRIKAVLQMGRKTFLRVVLLPQGQFDRLLTSTGTERTTLLRDLFGTDALAAVKEGALRQSGRLGELLAQAKSQRNAMPDDPAQAALQAGAAAHEAELTEARLSTAIDTVVRLRKTASTASAALASTDRADQALAKKAVIDIVSTLDELDTAAADLAVRRKSLDVRAEDADKKQGQLEERLRYAEARGERKDALGRAAAIVGKLATQVQAHRRDRERLDTRREELAAESVAIATANEGLALRDKELKPRADIADQALAASKQLQEHGSSVRTLVGLAVVAARQIPRGRHAVQTAVSKRDTAVKAVEPLIGQLYLADRAYRAAEERLEAIQLRDRAASVAAGAHPGDDCPVCQRELAADFQPGAGATVAELDEAKSKMERARADQEKVAKDLAYARGEVTAAEGVVAERAAARQETERTAQQALTEAERAIAEFADRVRRAGGDFDANAASAVLTATAADAAAQLTDAMQTQELIVNALTICEGEVADHANGLRAAIAHDYGEIGADRAALNSRGNAHKAAITEVSAEEDRHARAVRDLTDDLRTLPTSVQELLSDSAIDVQPDMAAAAAAAIAAKLAQANDVHNRLDEVRKEKSEVADDQRSLDREEHAKVDKPLNALRSRLESWRDAAAESGTHVDAAARPEVPVTPAEPTIRELRAFARSLSKTTTTLRLELSKTRAALTEQVAAAQAQLGEQAVALAEVDGFDTTTDLTEPEALHPIVEARAAAEKDVRSQREAQRAAEGQIKPAADLDFTIRAGAARRAALDVLGSELVDAKFLNHLTTLNTRTLLGVASDLLGDLSDERFGFADGFEIVSRGSGVVHSPTRLSGGEKFLASLALALALAELHSVTGPRLGSLFLDEGFATLDVAALQSALEVLRGKASDDRLVMVISHLHAVAEAVDDVLWVERGVSGSEARWLTADQRDELLRADLSSRLQRQA